MKLSALLSLVFIQAASADEPVSSEMRIEASCNKTFEQLQKDFCKCRAEVYSAVYPKQKMGEFADIFEGLSKPDQAPQDTAHTSDQGELVLELDADTNATVVLETILRVMFGMAPPPDPTEGHPSSSNPDQTFIDTLAENCSTS